jgi:hypothetical protein
MKQRIQEAVEHIASNEWREKMQFIISIYARSLTILCHASRDGIIRTKTCFSHIQPS